jgi:hypothetical protein
MVQKVTLLVWRIDPRHCIRRAPHCGLGHVVPTKPCRHETLEMSRHVGRLRRRPVICVYTSVLPNTSPSTGRPVRRCDGALPTTTGTTRTRHWPDTPHASTRSSRPRHQRSEATRRKQQNKQSTQTKRARAQVPEPRNWDPGAWVSELGARRSFRCVKRMASPFIFLHFSLLR